jgi:hypothetical protein
LPLFPSHAPVCSVTPQFLLVVIYSTVRCPRGATTARADSVGPAHQRSVPVGGGSMAARQRWQELRTAVLITASHTPHELVGVGCTGWVHRVKMYSSFVGWKV